METAFSLCSGSMDSKRTDMSSQSKIEYKRFLFADMILVQNVLM